MQGIRKLFLLITVCLYIFVKAMKAPLIVGLNPALQKSIAFAELVPGAVNRGLTAVDGIGGKGQNVAIAASYMGVRDMELMMFLGAGSVGDLVGSLLEEKIHINILQHTPLIVRTAAKCRTCISLVDQLHAETTEVIEPSEKISDHEVNMLLSHTATYYHEDKAIGVILMGSMPPGCPASLYADIITRSCNANSKVLFDTVSGLSEGISACATLACSSFIKINARELCKVVGMEVPKGGDERAPVTLPVLLAAAQKFVTQNPATSYLATTDGPYEATLINAKTMKAYRYSKPSLPRPLSNPIGAGDAVASGTAFAWTEGYRPPTSGLEVSGVEAVDVAAVDAFRWGLACGAASCLHMENSKVELHDAIAIYGACKVSII